MYFWSYNNATLSCGNAEKGFGNNKKIKKLDKKLTLSF
jgi:hypothetical protein